jgi:replicative DNA helicase
MSIVKRTLNLIDVGRSGSVQFIPTRIPKFDEYLHGTKKRTMYLYGAETGVGKTAFVRDKHVHTAYEEFKRINDPSKLDVLFVDFSLEISPEISMAAAMTRKIFMDYGKVLPVDNILMNLSDEDTQLVNHMAPYFEDFEKKLLVFDEEVTPNKYHDILMQIAKAYGTFTKEGRIISECGDYIPHNPNLYIIIIIDTVNLAETDSDHVTIKSTIDRISRISVWFRNKCNMTPIIIQQFNAEISAVDRSRYGIKTPLLRDFEDSKRPVKDADVVIGLYDPSRHLKEDEIAFKGYDITLLKSWFRSLHILKHRRGQANKYIPLKFDGAVGVFEQMKDAKDMFPEDYVNATRH